MFVTRRRYRDGELRKKLIPKIKRHTALLMVMMTHIDFKKFIADETDKWTKVIESADIKLNDPRCRVWVIFTRRALLSAQTTHPRKSRATKNIARLGG